MTDQSGPSPFARRALLFSLLYFSEGAPIGFIWWALPTVLSQRGVSLADTTALTATLVLPWTFKFLWAPLVDWLQSPWWHLRHWIVTSQLLMVATLASLLTLDLGSHLSLIGGILFFHAVAAATQDVSIDALCIASSHHEERGRLNGWMQAGMLLGRSLFGGGSILLIAKFGFRAQVTLLCLATGTTALLLFSSWARDLSWRSTADFQAQVNESSGENPGGMVRQLMTVLRTPTTWIGLGFALSAGAGFEALGAVQSPLLLQNGFSDEFIGWLLLVPNVGGMMLGSLAGGWLADRWGHRRAVLFGTVMTGAGVSLVAWALSDPGKAIPVSQMVSIYIFEAMGVGLLTASSYALLMDLAQPPLSATRYSLFMAGTNGCEFWAGLLAGQTIAARGTIPILGALTAVSLGGALTALLLLRRPAVAPG
ncbi:MAG: MFS transporter [Planctomycetaceae bacterium]|nr:MFS transporter [Planctomycetaceae bacterium]